MYLYSDATVAISVMNSIVLERNIGKSLSRVVDQKYVLKPMIDTNYSDLQ